MNEKRSIFEYILILAAFILFIIIMLTAKSAYENYLKTSYKLGNNITCITHNYDGSYSDCSDGLIHYDNNINSRLNNVDCNKSNLKNENKLKKIKKGVEQKMNLGNLLIIILFSILFLIGAIVYSLLGWANRY